MPARPKVVTVGRKDMASDGNGDRRLTSGWLSAPASLTRLPPSCLSTVLLTMLCLATTAHAADSVADALHGSIMRMEPRYTQYSEQKALAGCFDWERSTPDKPAVQYLAVSTPFNRGRGSVSVGRLASNALDRCHRARRRNEAECECQVIDRNGRNVLAPPDDFIRRFQ